MSIIKLSDEKVLDIFRKYEEQTIKQFIESCENNGYSMSEYPDFEGIWEEILSEMSSKDFMENVIDSMNNSIGIEEYGIINEDEEED